MPQQNPLTAWIVNPNRRHLTFQDVPVFATTSRPGATLRCGLFLDPHGYPDSLALTLGHGDGRRWQEVEEAGSLVLPANCMPSLVSSLAHLDRVRGVFLVP